MSELKGRYKYSICDDLKRLNDIKNKWFSNRERQDIIYNVEKGLKRNLINPCEVCRVSSDEKVTLSNYPNIPDILKRKFQEKEGRLCKNVDITKPVKKINPMAYFMRGVIDGDIKLIKMSEYHPSGKIGVIQHNKKKYIPVQIILNENPSFFKEFVKYYENKIDYNLALYSVLRNYQKSLKFIITKEDAQNAKVAYDNLKIVARMLKNKSGRLGKYKSLVVSPLFIALCRGYFDAISAYLRLIGNTKLTLSNGYSINSNDLLNKINKYMTSNKQELDKSGEINITDICAGFS